MRAPDGLAPTLLIGGTTAAGKSGLALELARHFDATVVSADAMTIYRHLDVGTAKPSAADREAVEHRCIDLREPDEEFVVADFVEEVEAVRRERERVIIAGGTPFYLSALVRPMARLPAGDPAVRAELEALPDPHARLAEVDPQTAERLHPNDRMRVVRALEVHVLTGRTLSELHAEGPARPALPCVHLWLDRDDLAERIEVRLRVMVDQGYVEETRRVLAMGFSPECKPLRSFAYRHLVDHVQGDLELEEALRRTARDTRTLSRKQRTWARGLGWAAEDPGVAWTLAEQAFGK